MIHARLILLKDLKNLFLRVIFFFLQCKVIQILIKRIIGTMYVSLPTFHTLSVVSSPIPSVWVF